MTPVSKTPRNLAAVGVVVSSAPRAALLATLQQLRPQLDIQLQEIAPVVGTAETGYRVEVDLNGIVGVARSIDLWLQIKVR